MRVLVLGGYGFFGSRIVTLLARETGLEILIAGRDVSRPPRWRRVSPRPPLC